LNTFFEVSGRISLADLSFVCFGSSMNLLKNEGHSMHVTESGDFCEKSEEREIPQACPRRLAFVRGKRTIGVRCIRYTASLSFDEDPLFL
jgi:hypothetical protein